MIFQKNMSFDTPIRRSYFHYAVVLSENKVQASIYDYLLRIFKLGFFFLHQKKVAA